ncbi:retrovirus-related pol polyprotein from transposon TNT 1-94 [Tanacetum coccineum]
MIFQFSVDLIKDHLSIEHKGNRGAHNRARNANAGQGKPVKCYNCNGVRHIARNCTQPKRPQNSDYFKDKMLLMQAQENGAVLDEEELLFQLENRSHLDADADKLRIFDSDVDDEPTAQSIFMANLSSVGSANPQAGPSNASILSEVHILENAIDHSVSNQDEHEIHNKVQPSNVIDSTSVHMCHVYRLIMIANVPHDPRALELKTTRTDFSSEHLNDKLENKLHSQDQSIQTVHMMLNPTQVYDQKTKTALGAQNPFYLRQAKKAQPTLYDGDELLKPHHVPVMVPSSEEELELAEATRNKLHVKMNDSACVEKRVNITPPNHSKENFMETFTPQTQLTHEQYQNLKERFGNKKPVTSSDAPSFDSLFVIGKLNEQIQSRGNTIHELKEKISRLTKRNSDIDPTFDLKALVSQNKDLTAKLNALHDHNECFRQKIQRSTRENSKCVTIPDCTPKMLAPGRYPIDVEPIPS